MDWALRVHSLYHTALGRLADQEGLPNAVRRLQSGGSLDSLANDLVVSAEFQERHGRSAKLDIKFIMTLYRDGVGRQPDPKSLLWWLKQKKDKGIRAKLLVAVAGSSEALDQILRLIARKRPDYARWIATHDTISSVDRVAIRAQIATFPSCPRISIVICGGDGAEVALRRSLQSLAAQLYSNWELCIAGNKLSVLQSSSILADPYWRQHSVIGGQPSARNACADAFIRSNPINNGEDTATATNAALSTATGEFVGFLRAGDLLPEHALYEVAVKLCGEPDADIIFSDCDQMDDNGRRSDPWFRPGWDPDLLLAHDYMSDLVLYRKKLLEKIGGLRSCFEGAELHDLAFRATRATEPDRIFHIPAILYHRTGPKYRDPSQATLDASRRAVREHLKTHGVNEALLEPVPLFPKALRVVWPMPETEPLVSTIILTRDRVDLLARCIDGVLHRTNYPNLELLIVDNESREPDALAFFDRLKQKEKQVRILHRPGPFNFSALNNDAAREARGDILLLLNNDTNVTERDWLRELVSHVIRPDVGIVGAKLLYENERVQHAGIVLGPKGAAIHRHRFAERNNPGYFGDLTLTQTLSAVTGACIAIRRALFFEVGGFDETNLQVSYNDVDLCLRLKKYGYRVVWTPFAELFHLELASRGLDSADPVKYERTLRESQHFLNRWGNLLDSGDPFYSPNILFGWDFCEVPSTPRRDKPWWNYFTENGLT